MGSRSRDRFGEGTNPNGEWTNSLHCFFFVNLDYLETNNIYRVEVGLEIPVSKLYNRRILTDYNFDNLPAQVVVLYFCDRMFEDFAQLLRTVLGIGSTGQGPFLLVHAVE